MLSLVGFSSLALVLLALTLVGILWAFNVLGMYNIGGVPNTLTEKLLWCAYAVLIASLWVGLITYSPITINLR